MTGALISQPASAQSDLEVLKKLNATFIHNFVTNDTASHSRILHPAFVCITSRGQRVERKAYLEAWTRGFDGYTYWDYRNEEISIFGNCALVRSINKYNCVRDGREIAGMSIYTDTYVKEKGKWLCVQAQITEVSPPHFPGDDRIVRSYPK
jgi:ketosteroid isomerase-like protein